MPATYGHAYYNSGVRYADAEGTSTTSTHSSTMYQLNTIADNPFYDRQISLNEICAGATETLQRMVANNPGGFLTSSITSLTAAMANCDAAITDDGIKLGLRKGRKQAKDTFRAGLPAAITHIYNGVAYKLGANDPGVTDCFPHGRAIFSECPDDALDNELGMTAAAITAKAGVLGAELVSEIGSLLSTWLALYAASEASSGAKISTQLTRKAAKELLADALFDVLLTVAKKYPKQRAMIDAWFQQSLFENPDSSGEEAEPDPPAPPPGP